MATKTSTTYTATTPDGTDTVTRTSTRAYTVASWVEFPADDTTPGQRIIGFHMTRAAAEKTYGGQSGEQVRWFKSLPHGVVEVATA